MRKKIGKHKDIHFVHGFARYFNSGLVIDSKSWNDLFDNMERYDVKSFKEHSFE